MQSSAVVTVRALVMLVCLFVVPLVAIFGSRLPPLFHAMVQGRGAAPATSGHEPSTDDARLRGGDAPAFAAAPEAAPAAAIPPDPTASLWAPPAVSHPMTGDDFVSHASHPGPIAGAPPLSVQTPPMASGVQVAAPIIPVRHAEPAGQDSFRQIERRLKELGATYWLLETFGNRGQLYRFYCKVSVAGDPHHTHPFDATNEDPLQAMRLVLEHVERWRSGAEH